MSGVVPRRCSRKKLSWKFRKIRKEIPVVKHLSNNDDGLLALVFKNLPIADILQNNVVSQGNTCVEVSLLIKFIVPPKPFVFSKTMSHIFSGWVFPRLKLRTGNTSQLNISTRYISIQKWNQKLIKANLKC